MRWLQLAAAVLSASAFTVHQHSTEEHCVDLQCPATAFEYGIRNLISEETLKSDKCMSCQQCTGSGYSLCLQMSSSRGRRGGDEDGCSCTHSVPANCHNQLSNTKHPANITMNLFHVCYLSALQAPPRPLAVNDKTAVIVTVESFWHEPYWRDLQMDNLTLHYEFIVQKPEHCEGDLITNEGDRVEHVCKSTVNLEMSKMSDEPRDDDDYEHSDNYDQYDDSLPPEVQFDRDVFDGAKLLKVFYTVEVRRPRQLTKGNSDPFRDITTTLESEVLKFDLKPEVYGTGEVPELPSPTDFTGETEGVEDDENVSEEHGDGTNFFVDDAKDTKSEEQLEKEEEDLEKEIEAITSTTSTTTTTTTTTEASTTTEEEVEETTTQEDEETTTETEEEETTTEKEDEENQEAEKEDNDEDTENKEDEENKEEEDTNTPTDDDEKQGEEEKDAVEEEEKEGEAETTDDGEQTEDDEKEAEEGDAATEKTVEFFGHTFNKSRIARYCMGCAAVIFLLSVLCYCFRKRLCCCYQSESKTTSNGYRYNNPNRTNELVCSPEKERLHQ